MFSAGKSAGMISGEQKCRADAVHINPASSYAITLQQRTN
jgi:hypothetical protein